MTGSGAQVVMEEAQCFTGCHSHAPGCIRFLTKLWGEAQQTLLSAIGHNFLMLSLKGCLHVRERHVLPLDTHKHKHTGPRLTVSSSW